MITLRFPSRFAGALAALVALVGAIALPAQARTSYVNDGGSLFSPSTVTSLNTTIGDFNAQTGKEVVVVTVPSLGGATPQAAAEKVFAQQQVNGVLVFLSKAEKVQGVLPGTAAKAFFPPGETESIRSAMRGYFRTGDFDTGITTGVNLIIDQYRSHARSSGAVAPVRRQNAPASSAQSFGGGMSLFWLILILLAGFLIIRAVFRAMSRPRMMPPGYGGPGGPGAGPGGPGYGGGGPGYGYGGGGGGGFMSGLLGGLGGAFLGNELFNRGGGGIGTGGVENAGVVGTDPSVAQDAGGFQNDAGQADMSNASFGDYGSSGGGFGDGGGFGGGDFGGGGGGDFGGGGDSGGGW